MLKVVLMIAALALVLVLDGCADLTLLPARTISRPTRANRIPARGLAAELRRAQDSHELPSPASPQYAPGAGSPVQAIRRFAQEYVNWSAANVERRMGSLARTSVGQARSEMSMTAADVRGDRTLSEAGIANHGTVEAVAPLAGKRDSFVVVTREWTTAAYTSAYQGLAPAWHLTLVTVATVRRSLRSRHGGPRWAVSVWQPEN